MWNTMKYKTLKWKLVEYIEKPKISHIVQRELSDSSELFAQITVRFHSKQVNFSTHKILNMSPIEM